MDAAVTPFDGRPGRALPGSGSAPPGDAGRSRRLAADRAFIADCLELRRPKARLFAVALALRIIAGAGGRVSPLRYRVHGNWCGPNYGAGVPVDDLDRACMRHDMAYGP